MIRRIIITTTASFLFLILGIHVYARPAISQEKSQQQMKEHLNKVKSTSPKKYNDMVKRAGGNITLCVDCHIETGKETRGNMGLPMIRR
jgi:hypothetical protein